MKSLCAPYKEELAERVEKLAEEGARHILIYWIEIPDRQYSNKALLLDKQITRICHGVT